MFSQSFTELVNHGELANIYVRVLFSEKSAKTYILLLLLPFGGLACFVAF
jgi:hypothetical protein